MQTVEIKGVRNEADLYGYSIWLAEHLGLEIAPRALRNFQHGWIWWDFQDDSFHGLDPNIDHYWGVLVQDDQVAQSLIKRKIFSKACGLPYLNYLEFSGAKGFYKRTEGMLYVPIHSNPWHDAREDLVKSAIRFSKKHPDCSIMLSWSDKSLAQTLQPYFKNVEIGAGALEITSLVRLAKIFQTYDTMITDSIGSHVLYGIASGMKVGIDSSLYFNFTNTENYKVSWNADIDKKQNANYEYFKLDYLDKRFPGLVIDGEAPKYTTMPEMPFVEPKEIAQLLGWEITYECEIVKA